MAKYGQEVLGKIGSPVGDKGKYWFAISNRAQSDMSDICSNLLQACYRIGKRVTKKRTTCEVCKKGEERWEFPCSWSWLWWNIHESSAKKRNTCSTARPRVVCLAAKSHNSFPQPQNEKRNMREMFLDSPSCICFPTACLKCWKIDVVLSDSLEDRGELRSWTCAPGRTVENISFVSLTRFLNDLRTAGHGFGFVADTDVGLGAGPNVRTLPDQYPIAILTVLPFELFSN